jgi:hypothetical protein
MWKLTLGYDSRNAFVEHDKKSLNLPLQTLIPWNGNASVCYMLGKDQRCEYSAWHLKATPNVGLKYSSHTMFNPKNSTYLCSTSHAEQSYTTHLSKSLFLAKILSVEIDDFCPNLVGAAHIWPQGFIHG